MDSPQQILVWVETMPEGWRNEFPSSDIYGEGVFINPETMRCMRISLGLTQKELAEYIGVKPPYIHSIEKGERPPNERITVGMLYLAKQQEKVASYIEQEGGIVVEKRGFYRLQDNDGGVVYAPASWLAMAVGRASIEVEQSLALAHKGT
jgi:DNA-binding helix-turn-helix protein